MPEIETATRMRCPLPAAVPKTCLVGFDNNKYFVAAGPVGPPVEIRAHAECIELRQDGRIVDPHQRYFGRIAAIMAKVSVTSETCRCQLCHDLVSM